MKSSPEEVVAAVAAPDARRSRDGAALLFVAVLVALPAGEAVAQSASPSALERCLLERLREADPGTTVAALRAACDAVSIPPAPGPARTTAGGASQVDDTRAVDTRADAPPESPGGTRQAGEPRPVPGLTSSPVERRIVSESRVWGERFALLPHRPNYLLPFSHVTSEPNSVGGDAQRNEIKFQISFKLPLTPPLFEGKGALFFAYTGQAWWQAYNKDVSAPFREYSHEPEIFAAWRPSGSFLGWSPRLATAGFVHQSNGRTTEYSRSWNRLFAELTLDRPDGWWLALRPWWRIPEDPKPSPDSPEGDDNPDITKYAGDGEIRLGYAGGEQRWTLTMRRGLDSGDKGSAQIDWSRPTGFSPQLRWHVQYFDGYGESLIDYDRRLRRLSFGVMLNDWY